MCTDRRNFLRLSAGLAGTALLTSTIPANGMTDEAVLENSAEAWQQRVPESIRKLQPMMGGKLVHDMFLLGA